MKILQIANCFNSTPLYANLFRAMAKLDIKQEIYCAIKKNQRSRVNVSWANDLDYKVSPIFSIYDRIFFKEKSNKAVRDIVSKIDVAQYDLIHAHTLYSDGVIANYLNSIYNIPYVVAFRNTDINVFRKFRPDLKRVEDRIVADASALFSISPAYAREYGCTFKKEIIVVPNGIDDSWFTEFEVLNSLSLKDAGVRGINVLSVNDLSPNKNIEKGS